MFSEASKLSLCILFHTFVYFFYLLELLDSFFVQFSTAAICSEIYFNLKKKHHHSHATLWLTKAFC